ncbi:hypothetical protein, partial [Vibrio cholerae]|uniref:hypothetical protein n=1 Tax=Vibrio cholerae TaxID=666 RepID=UPI001172ECCC
IWLSVNFDVFIKNLLRLWYEKILLLTSVNLWGDYPTTKLKHNNRNYRGSMGLETLRVDSPS